MTASDMYFTLIFLWIFIGNALAQDNTVHTTTNTPAASSKQAAPALVDRDLIAFCRDPVSAICHRGGKEAAKEARDKRAEAYEKIMDPIVEKAKKSQYTENETGFRIDTPTRRNTYIDYSKELYDEAAKKIPSLDEKIVDLKGEVVSAFETAYAEAETLKPVSDFTRRLKAVSIIASPRAFQRVLKFLVDKDKELGRTRRTNRNTLAEAFLADFQLKCGKDGGEKGEYYTSLEYTQSRQRYKPRYLVICPASLLEMAEPGNKEKLRPGFLTQTVAHEEGHAIDAQKVVEEKFNPTFYDSLSDCLKAQEKQYGKPGEKSLGRYMSEITADSLGAETVARALGRIKSEREKFQFLQEAYDQYCDSTEEDDPEEGDLLHPNGAFRVGFCGLYPRLRKAVGCGEFKPKETKACSMEGEVRL